MKDVILKKSIIKALYGLILCAALCILTGSSSFAITAGALKSTADKKSSFHISYENADVIATFLEGDVLKIEVFARGIDSGFPSFLTVTDGAPAPVWSKNDTASRTVSAGKLKLTFSDRDAGLNIITSDGTQLLDIPAGEIEWSATGSYRVSFKKEKGDRYFGLGEPLPDTFGRDVTYDNRKLVRPIWNQHVPPSDLGLPYFFNPRGYAIYFDNPWKAEFDMAGGPLFDYKAEGGPLRFYVIATSDAFKALERYTALTGRSPMPPRWSTGYLQSKYGYRNVADFRWLMDNFRSRKIPCDTLIFDLDWFVQMGNLWWDKGNFPDGPAFMKELESKGFKAITIVEPYVFMESTNYNAANNKNLFTRTEKGTQHRFPFWGGRPAGLMDFTNPDTQQWFADKIARIHDSGVDAWWTDLDEPETEFDETWYLLGHRFGSHNLQAFLMNKTIHDLYDKKYPDERVMIMSRSGFSGIQRFGTGVWSGDVQSSFQHLKNQIPIGLSTSISGLAYWNSDVGGFHKKPSTELYVRWMQFGAFCPVFRAHGNHSDREPWSYGPDAEKILRNLIELRYRLSPYLYSLFYRTYINGAPIMTPTFMEFPTDPDSLIQIGQFFHGPSLLVAPVVDEGAKTKKIYLPPGEWTDFYTNEVISGPKTISCPVTLETLPLFAREGAIIPLGPVMQYIGEKTFDPIEIHYYPSSKETNFDMYEDDGATRAYERDEFSIIRFSAVKGTDGKMSFKAEQSGKYKGMPEKRTFKIVLHGAASKSSAVTVDGKKSDSATYDAAAKTVTVTLDKISGGFAIEAAF